MASDMLRSRITSGTRRVAELSLDAARLQEDLVRAASFAYGNSYSEFICGTLDNTMLFNRTGELAEAQLTGYDGAAKPTAHGTSLPYVSELICRLFDTRHLKYARLLKLTPGSVIVPHRDYLELEQDFCRIHIPLRTDSSCFNSEMNIVYQMRMGEVWYLDAARTHSAASFSDTDRIHLVLDFMTRDFDNILRFDLSPGESIPRSSIVNRRPLDATGRTDLLNFSRVIDSFNYREILALLIKRHFVTDISADEVFKLLREIAAQSGRPDVLKRAVQQQEYCLVQR